MSLREDVPFSWGTFSDAFLDELSSWIGGRSVLEIFAGNGLLASRLSIRGTDVLSTSLFSGHDDHARGMHHPVIELDAAAAVRSHGQERDILLMCWPVATEDATKALLSWGEDKPVVFIGEVTNHDLGFGGLGGCASDLFFELTKETHVFGSYSPRNNLERAAVRTLDPLALRNWLDNRETEMPSYRL